MRRMTQASLFQTQIGATLSPCRQYRYSLWRIWNPELPRVAFIGLNPSTADETADDPTIRRCIGFAKSWGYGGLHMVNLFAFRATAPKVMKAAADPVGPDNNAALLACSQTAGLLIAAWGGDKFAQSRAAEVCKLLGRRIECLGFTDARAPRHPLYMKGDCQPQLFFDGLA